MDNNKLYEMMQNNEFGGWGVYGLASIALKYYFPEEYTQELSTSEEADLLEQAGCRYWSDIALKYNEEVGYTDNEIDRMKLNE